MLVASGNNLKGIWKSWQAAAQTHSRQVHTFFPVLDNQMGGSHTLEMGFSSYRSGRDKLPMNKRGFSGFPTQSSWGSTCTWAPGTGNGCDDLMKVPTHLDRYLDQDNEGALPPWLSSKLQCLYMKKLMCLYNKISRGPQGLSSKWWPRDPGPLYLVMLPFQRGVFWVTIAGGERERGHTPGFICLSPRWHIRWWPMIPRDTGKGRGACRLVSSGGVTPFERSLPIGNSTKNLT